MDEPIVADVYFWSAATDMIEMARVSYRANPFSPVFAHPWVAGANVPDELLRLRRGTAGRLTVGVDDVVVDELPVRIVRVFPLLRRVHFLSRGPFRITSEPIPGRPLG